MAMMFNFKLHHPQKCAGLDAETFKESYICWFYLTDSEYYIELDDVKLFQHAPEAIEKYRAEWPEYPEFLDYQYSRQLEDLFDVLPLIACPLPARMYALIDTEEKRALLHNHVIDIWEAQHSELPWNELDERYNAITWTLIRNGYLGQGYLRVNAKCQFFHVDETVVIQYNFIDEDEDGLPVWSAGEGSYSLPYDAFVAEIKDLLDRFFAAMDKQVEMASQIFREYTPRITRLVEEHKERRDYFYGILNAVKNGEYRNHIDWQQIEQDLDSVLSRGYLEL